MAYRGETTPLIARGTRDTHDVGPRRRVPQQYRDNPHNDDDDGDDTVFSPSIDDFNKEDRRSWIGRLGTSAFFPVSPCRQVDRDDVNYYEDDYNEHSWRCSFGTHEEDGIWMNRNDQAGTIMAFLVWVIIFYSGVTVTLLAQNNHLPTILAMCYCTICALALASHGKTSFTDPGAVPQAAVPMINIQNHITPHMMCSHCQAYKPPGSHHCRICNRCISHMDHHCPWMNNCIGAGNFKHFILFLSYTWLGSAFALIVFAWNYFLCATENCMFSVVLVQLVRAMTVICLSSLLFISSMLMNVTYGVMTGLTTIDRLKKKATDTLVMSDEEPIPLTDIFGIEAYWKWFLPIDPVFDDYDRVMGFCTPQRLLREQMRETSVTNNATTDRKGYAPV